MFARDHDLKSLWLHLNSQIKDFGKINVKLPSSNFMSKFLFSKAVCNSGKTELEVVEYLSVYSPTMKSMPEDLCNFVEP